MTTSRDQTSERGQGPASAPGNFGRAQSQSKRELPSLEEIARVIHKEVAGSDPDELIHAPWQKSWEAPAWRRHEQWEEAAKAIEALFSTVGSDSRVRELETERDSLGAALREEVQVRLEAEDRALRAEGRLSLLTAQLASAVQVLPGLLTLARAYARTMEVDPEGVADIRDGSAFLSSLRSGSNPTVEGEGND